MGGKLERMERKMDRLTKTVLKDGNYRQNMNNILPSNLTQQSKNLQNNSRARIQKNGKEHLLNMFKVFNPFNFVTDPDQIRKYHEELRLKQMDPAKRRIFLKEKRYKEKEQKLKADRKFDLRRLDNKDQQIKEQIKQHRERQEYKMQKQRNQHANGLNNSPSKRNSKTGKLSSKRASKRDSINEANQGQDSKKDNNQLEQAQNSSNLGLNSKNGQYDNDYTSYNNFDSNTPNYYSGMNSPAQNNPKNLHNDSYFNDNIHTENNEVVKPLIMFNTTNGIQQGTMEDYHKYKALKNQEKKEKQAEKKLRRAEKKEERRILREKLMEDLKDKAERILNGQGMGSQRNSRGFDENVRNEKYDNSKGQRVRKQQRNASMESEDSNDIKQVHNKGKTDYQFSTIN